MAGKGGLSAIRLGKIIYKSFKDIIKFLASILWAFMLTIIIPTAASFLLKRKIDLPYIKEYLIIFSVFLGIALLYFFLKRLIVKISKNDIRVFQLRSTKDPENKIFLRIQNDNDEDFTNVDVSLMVIFVGKTEYAFVPILSDKKQFSNGLKETGNIITGNNHVMIEIAENVRGILKLLLDEEAVYDILSGMPEYQKNEIFRLIIKVTGKLDETTVISHLYEGTFSHFINEHMENFIGGNPPQFASKIEWINLGKEISPIKNPKVLAEIQKAIDGSI